MNLTNFLKQIDSLTAKYTAEQLAFFIHDTARVLPEKHRADFLKRLKEADATEQDVQEKRNQCGSYFSMFFTLLPFQGLLLFAR